jgi:hypothetical protein
MAIMAGSPDFAGTGLIFGSSDRLETTACRDWDIPGTGPNPPAMEIRQRKFLSGRFIEEKKPGGSVSRNANIQKGKLGSRNFQLFI